MQSDWLKPFWFMTQDSELSQIWDLRRQKANNSNFNMKSTKTLKTFTSKMPKLLENLIYSHSGEKIFLKN